MSKDIEASAAALYDGGWRKKDKEQLMEEYELSKEEAEALCSKLAEHERNELLDQLVETMEKISENWEQYKMEEHDATYPFAESFDELTSKVSNWRDSILGLRQ